MERVEARLGVRKEDLVAMAIVKVLEELGGERGA